MATFVEFNSCKASKDEGKHALIYHLNITLIQQEDGVKRNPQTTDFQTCLLLSKQVKKLDY